MVPRPILRVLNSSRLFSCSASGQRRTILNHANVSGGLRSQGKIRADSPITEARRSRGIIVPRLAISISRALVICSAVPLNKFNNLLTANPPRAAVDSPDPAEGLETRLCSVAIGRRTRDTAGTSIVLNLPGRGAEICVIVLSAISSALINICQYSRTSQYYVPTDSATLTVSPSRCFCS